MTTPTSTVSSAGDIYTGLNKAAQTKSQTQETQDRFLKLLITQLKSQDPLNPMDNAATTTQMAQMSTVTGIDNLNATMNSMMASFNAGQSYQAANLIGKQVMVEGDTLNFDGSSAVSAELKVPTDGVSVKVGVYNAQNQKVDEIDLGTQKLGRQPIAWDGKDASGKALPAGKYYLAATATAADGTQSQLSTYTYMGVTSVSIANGTVNLQLTDGRSVPYNGVSSIKS